jgi:aryl-alcohol dehydrogenase-like predicted oxidoreductase
VQRRRLGTSGPEIFPFSFGGNVFGWTADEATSFRLLDEFVAAGGNLIDTADVYSGWAPGNHGGESETIIGRWLERSGQRDRVLLATKVGMEMDPTRKGLSPAYIESEVKESLRRLRTDRIDLYQAHIDDADTPLEETLGAFARLIESGTVGAIGASNYTAERLEEALRVSRENGLPAYVSLQPRYNLYDRADFETALEGVCTKHGLGVITYSSLASGFLTGKYRSVNDFGKSARGPRMRRLLNERGIRILDALDEIARESGATPVQVALAWLIARPSVSAPIASATSVEQLRELLAATELSLGRTAIDRLDRASA